MVNKTEHLYFRVSDFQRTHFKASRKPYSNIEDPRLRWLSTNFPAYMAKWKESVEARGAATSCSNQKDGAE